MSPRSPKALTAAWREKKAPTLVYTHTTMAKNVVGADGTSFEGAVSTHGQPLNAAARIHGRTIRRMGGDAQNPFQIFPDVKAAFDERLAELPKVAAKWNRQKAKWDSENPDKAKTLADWLSGNSIALNLRICSRRTASRRA